MIDFIKIFSQSIYKFMYIRRLNSIFKSIPCHNRLSILSLNLFSSLEIPSPRTRLAAEATNSSLSASIRSSGVAKSFRAVALGCKDATRTSSYFDCTCRKLNISLLVSIPEVISLRKTKIGYSSRFGLHYFTVGCSCLKRRHMKTMQLKLVMVGNFGISISGCFVGEKKRRQK